MIPLPVRVALIFVAGVCLGSLVNWAIYALAWRPRAISPWSQSLPDAPSRRGADRIPLWGWFGLRREASLHGRGFWIRPLLVELGLGLALAALYWWEVARLGLIEPQVGAAIAAPLWAVHLQFASHAILLCWMLAASFIDIDEKIIPDEITVTGTLLGLVLAAALPMALLPHVAEHPAAPQIGEPIRLLAGPPAIGRNGAPLWLEPVSAVAPQPWPPAWAQPADWRSLAAALACYGLWCFALAPRVWRGRRGPVFATRLIAARVYQEFGRPPLRTLWILGTTFIVAIWATSLLFGGNRIEPAWAGLLTALVSMAGTGVFVWAVRIMCSSALRVEALGFGDVTLMMMIATFVGWQACVIAFFIAPLAGLVIGIAQYAVNRDNSIPYGPFLCLATAIVVVEWARLWMWLEPLFAVWWLVPTALAVCLLLMWAMLTVWAAIKRIVFRG
jgi:leader peptidase (prepilin peptidase) / N-methyltransferase